MSITTGIKHAALHYLSRRKTGHILLYHSCYEEIPADLNFKLHNVRPSVMYTQFSWYKKHYQIVSLEEWFEAKKKKGLVAVTFDDAYLSVFNEGLPVLESLEIPATVFVIGGTLEGKIFWRDKIRFLKQKGRLDSLVRFLNRVVNTGFTASTFYKESKSGEALSMQKLNQLIDRFIKMENLEQAIVPHCAHQPEQLIDHPLLSYGYHTYSHFRLSSLSDSDQREDLIKGYRALNRLESRPVIPYYSLPFGGHDSYNTSTMDILNTLSMKGVLLNNNKLNGYSHLPRYKNLFIAERYMMPDTLDELIGKVHTLAYNHFVRPKKEST